MNRILTTLALLAVVLCTQAQMKYHDMEVNEVKGPVKSITMKDWGRPVVTYISPEGKMSCEKLLDAVYDENGYLQSIVSQLGGILVHQDIESDVHVTEFDFYDIILDDHGNWIRRSTKVAGIEIMYPRTIEYYE